MKEILGCCVSLVGVDGLDVAPRVQDEIRERAKAEGGSEPKLIRGIKESKKAYLINSEGIRNFLENKVS